MVLQNYSWQDFMLSAFLLLVLWYLGVWWYYRRKDLGPPGVHGEPLPHGWQDRVEDLSGVDGVMGASKLDPGVSLVEAEDFGFFESADRDEQLGLIPDVQQEIKSICSLLAEKDGTKEDFFSMFFMLVRDQYPEVPAAAQTALSQFIREHVPFHLSAEELENLWS